MLLLVCGDIALNPGPGRDPCGSCHRLIPWNGRAIYCDACYTWNQISCEGISQKYYIKLETKIDGSFPNAQFAVDNYHLWRADRTASSGGVMAYLRSDMAGDRSKLLRVTEDWKRDLDENKYSNTAVIPK
ncbi:hypothetical protein DPMN_178874, partial [Dreissena polymorpha]